jgi:hypothetical protein
VGAPGRRLTIDTPPLLAFASISMRRPS